MSHAVRLEILRLHGYTEAEKLEIARNYLLKKHDDDEAKRRGRSKNPLVRFQKGFEERFERLRRGYRTLLSSAIDGGAKFALLFILAMAAVVCSIAVSAASFLSGASGPGGG